ncbi:MAG: hypothetical protein EOP19_03240, partial [Hyphomicrobiales bacterium]
FTSAGIEPAAGPEATSPDGTGSYVDLGVQHVGDGFERNTLLGNSEFGGAGFAGIENVTGNVAPPLILASEGIFVLADDGLLGGNRPDGLSDATVATGKITASDADLFAFAFVAPAGDFFSAGHLILWDTTDPTNISGYYVGDEADRVDVITASITAGGNWTIQLLKPIDHIGGSANDALVMPFQVIVTDFGAPPLSTLVPISITIEDDIPVVSTNPAVIIDEDDLLTGIGNTDSNGDETPAHVTGTLGVNFGADGAGSVAFIDYGLDLPYGFSAATSLNGSVMTISQLQGGSYVPVVVVTITNSATGAYSVQIVNPIDHPQGTIPGYEDNVQFTITYRATDSDGDAGATDGTLIIRANDDMPVTFSNPLVQLDDDALPNGNLNGVGDDIEQAMTGTLNFNYGADGAGQVLWTSVGLDLPYGFWYSLSSDGIAMTITQLQGESYVDIATFTITNTTTGAYSIVQHNPVMHASGNDENNAQVTIAYRVTDGDNDVAAGSLSVNFDDDTPVIEAQTPGTEMLVNGDFSVGFEPNGDIWGPNSGIDSVGASGWTVVQVDGEGPKVLERVGDGLGLLHSSTHGNMVDLEASTGNIMISREVAGLTQGETYVLTFEAGRPDYSPSNTMEVLWNGVVVAEITSANAMQTYTYYLTAGAGSNTVAFREKGGTEEGYGTYLANVGLKTSTVLVVDEDLLPKETGLLPGGLGAGIEGGPGDATAAGVSATGSLGILWGSDNGSARDVIFSSSMNGASGLFSRGVAVIFSVSSDGHTLLATAGDRPVFTVTLDPTAAKGSFTFTLQSELDHRLNSVEDNLPVNFSFVARASDGDPVSGKFTVVINDDSPVAPTELRVSFDDDELVGFNGNPGGIGDGSSSNNASGTLAIQFGADGGTVAWSGATFISANHKLSHLITGSLIEIFQLQGEPAVSVKVMTATLDPSTGAYEIKQIAPFQHPAGADENEMPVNLNYRVTDGDGDISDGTIRVVIDDDTPVIDPALSGLTGANLIVNGQFLNGPFGAEQPGWGGQASSGNAIDGWTITGGAPLERNPANWYVPDPVGGGRVVDLDASPGNVSISQTIPGLSAGQLLTLSFDAARPAGYDAEFTVLWNDQSFGPFTPSSAAFEQFSIQVVANSGSNVLTFVESGASDFGGTFLANVSLVAASTFVDEDGLAGGIARAPGIAASKAVFIDEGTSCDQ